MISSARPSFREDREEIKQLLMDAIGIDASAGAVSEAFLNWKYWNDHPLFREARSQVLVAGSSVVAHAGGWPVCLQTGDREVPALQLIDWAACRSTPGAGTRVLRALQANVSAVLSVGGSDMTRELLPILRFKSYNQISFLHRPLRPFDSALRDSPSDWKLPARILRNLKRCLVPRVRMPFGWSFSPVSPLEVAASLLPRSSGPTEAISVRTPELLEHVLQCPLFAKAGCYLLHNGGRVTGYFCLANAHNQTRLIDYGPNGLDANTAYALGVAVQQLARSEFQTADVLAATTEQLVRYSLHSAGFHLLTQEPVKVLKVSKDLELVSQFRMTLFDWDACCL